MSFLYHQQANDKVANKLNILSFFVTPWHHRKLIARMSKREIAAKYKGSLLGLMWVFIAPLLLLLIYTLFLGTFLRAKWGDNGMDSLSLCLFLFVGLNFYNFFSESLSKSPDLIRGNINYVKKVIFPIEILPWIVISSSLVSTTVSFLILIGFHWLVLGPIPLSSLCLFPLVISLLFYVLAAIYFISSLSVYIRDTGPALTFIITALMFLSPIFYSLESMSAPVQRYLRLNPLTFIIEQGRSCLLDGHMIDWSGYGKFTCLGLGFAFLGYRWFQKTKIGFADVL